MPSATNELEETEQESGERDYGDQEEDDAMRAAHDFLADLTASPEVTCAE